MTNRTASNAVRQGFSHSDREAGLKSLLDSIKEGRNQAALLHADMVVSLMEMAQLEVVRLSKVNRTMQQYMDKESENLT